MGQIGLDEMKNTKINKKTELSSKYFRETIVDFRTLNPVGGVPRWMGS